jgi:hypothetical protein
MPGNPLYIDPATLPPQQQLEHMMAKFNYEFVTEDWSYGSHNAPYARILLAETETFLGLPPWFMPEGGSWFYELPKSLVLDYDVFTLEERP